MNTAPRTLSYTPPKFTPALIDALERLGQQPTFADLRIVLDALGTTQGANQSWTVNDQSVISFELLTPHDWVSYSLSHRLRQYWPEATAYLATAPLSPALALVGIEALLSDDAPQDWSLLTRLLQTVLDHTSHGLTIHLPIPAIQALSVPLVHDLITHQRVRNLIPLQYGIETLERIHAWTTHPGAAGLLVPLLTQLHQYLKIEDWYDFAGLIHDPQLWTELREFFLPKRPLIRVALLCSPCATPADMKIGLHTLSKVKLTPFRSFPSAHFAHADWQALSPLTLFQALTHLYNAERPDAHLPPDVPPQPVLEQGILTLGLLANTTASQLLQDYRDLRIRHDNLLQEGIDVDHWLPDRLSEILGRDPSSHELFAFTTALVQWSLEDPVARTTIAATLHDFVIRWLASQWTRDTMPYTLTKTLYRLAPPFLRTPQQPQGQHLSPLPLSSEGVSS